MKLNILTFVLLIFLLSCKQKNSENLNQAKKAIVNTVDTSIIAVIPFDTNQYYIFRESEPTELTSSDLRKIETLINRLLNEYNTEQEKQYKEFKKEHPKLNVNKNDYIINLKRYKRQYVASINSKGEKVVWVNCFCDAWDFNWKKNLIFVNDGGNCFFNLKINLTTEAYFDFSVNGEA